MVTFEAFVGFLVQITEDTTSPDQVRESFRGIAGEKVCCLPAGGWQMNMCGLTDLVFVPWVAVSDRAGFETRACTTSGDRLSAGSHAPVCRHDLGGPEVRFPRPFRFSIYCRSTESLHLLSSTPHVRLRTLLVSALRI